MKSILITAIALGSVGFIALGRRAFGEGDAQLAFIGLGVVGLAVALGLRVRRFTSAEGESRGIEQKLLFATGAVALSLGLYALSTSWGLDVLGLDRSSDAGVFLAVLWPAVLLVSVLCLLGMEVAYRHMPVAESVEPRRISWAFGAALSLGLAIVAAAAFNYVAHERDWKKDLSYFRTTEPSEGTVQMVSALGEPVRAVLFFPTTDEVLQQVEPYFRALDSKSEMISVDIRDHALEPELTRKHRIRGNGFILLTKGEENAQQAERIEIGSRLETARTRLRTLDSRFQQAFTRLTKVRREIHRTVGHDERSASGGPSDDAGSRTRELDKALERSNVETKPLGVGQGLANEVPSDTPAVVVMGPRTPFLPEEVSSLIRYVKGGGRLLLMLDPKTEHGLDPLLAELGLAMLPGIAASERSHGRRSHTRADRGLVFTKRYSSHPTVTSASRKRATTAALFANAGALTKVEREGVNVVFPLRSPSVQGNPRGAAFFLDVDGDWESGPDEQPRELNLMAAVTIPGEGGREGRAVVIADGDFATDQIIRNEGNALILSDILQWMLGQEEIVGAPTSEEDIRIEHTSDEDKLWFYLTSYGIPVPVLLLGLVTALRRRKKSGRASETETDAETETESEALLDSRPPSNHASTAAVAAPADSRLAAEVQEDRGNSSDARSERRAHGTESETETEEGAE